jgi:hypothetical protein
MGSLLANNSGDYARRAANLPTFSAYTMAGWVKLDDFSAATSVYMCWLDGTSSDAGLLVNANEAYILAAAGATKFGAHFTAGSWVYIAITGNGTNTVGYWWTDNSGSPQLGNSTTRTTTGAGDISQMTVCARHTAGTGATGKYAYWKVWDRVLTQANLEAEMFAPGVVDSTNFNTGFADSETDIGPNGRDWTWNSITTDSDTPPVSAGLTPIVMTWTL